MDNAVANFNSIKQPSPNIAGQNAAVQNKERIYNAPYLGAIDVPNISRTPLTDTMIINQQKHPKPKIKIAPKADKGFNLQNIFSFAILGSSLIALLRLIKK